MMYFTMEHFYKEDQYDYKNYLFSRLKSLCISGITSQASYGILLQWYVCYIHVIVIFRRLL